MIIRTPYEFGDMVYIKTDTEQRQWMITELKVMPRNLVIYTLYCGTMSASCYEFELSREKDYSKAT